MESDISSIEKRFAYGFLQKLLKWMEIAQEFIAHLGIVGQRWKIVWCTFNFCHCVRAIVLYIAICFTEAVVSSGRVEKSPHEQEIKFFAKVRLLCECKILVLVISVLNVENPLNSLSQILMPLINQYFKNHCLYFLSTPAKVLGSGGHSSNKEKEMIARWCLCFINMTQKYIYLYIFYSNIMFLLLWAFDFFLSFLFLPFPFFHFVVSSVKCLLWWGTEFLSLVRWQTCSTTLSESFLSLLCLCVFLYFVSCNAPFCHPG